MSRYHWCVDIPLEIHLRITYIMNALAICYSAGKFLKSCDLFLHTHHNNNIYYMELQEPSLL